MINSTITLDVQKDFDDQLFELLKLAKPDWSPDTIQFSFLSNGTVNKLIACSSIDNHDDKILVRINGNGSDMFIDRQKEIKYLKLLKEKSLAAKLLIIFQNGLIYDYIPGDVITVETIRAPQIYPLIARKMALMHRTVPNISNELGGANNGQPWLWNKILTLYDRIPLQFSDKIKQRRFEQSFGDKSFLKAEIDLCMKLLRNCENSLVFCHNDLLIYNIIYNKELHKVDFIDYEFADFNYQAFDIGNHFAEFSGVDLMDFSRYPDKEFQKSWLRVYLKEFHEDEDYDNEKEITRLLNLVNQFYLVSHLLWGSFALFQAEESHHDDTDFLLMFERRIQDYFRRKDDYLT